MHPSELDNSKRVKPMSAISDVSTLNHFARLVEKSEARQLSISEQKARTRIANRIGVSPGTLENIRRLRTKIVPNWLMNKVRVELIAVLQSEIQRLEHEIHIARQTGVDYRDDSLVAAEAQLAKAREALEGGVK